jgi:uncharacterized Zn-binding protein involved in type VI secretion
MSGRRIACLGDPVGYGTIISSGQDGSFKVNGVEVAVDGAIARRPGEWIRALVPTVTKTFHNGKRVIVENDETTGGNIVHPPDRGVYVE